MTKNQHFAVDIHHIGYEYYKWVLWVYKLYTNQLGEKLLAPHAWSNYEEL